MTTILLRPNVTDLCRSKGTELHLKCVIALVGSKCGNVLILGHDHLWNKSIHIHTYTHIHINLYTHTHTRTHAHTHTHAYTHARLYIPLLLPILLSSRLFIVLQATDLL